MARGLASFSVLPDKDPSAGYPVNRWSEQRRKYWEYWYHFDGAWLEETLPGNPNVLKYPLRLNPFNMACLLHASYLFGEVADASPVLVNTVVEPRREVSERLREKAQRVADFISRVWEENNGASLQQEAGIVSQIHGGCVFGVAYDPSRKAEGKLPIRIDHVLPEYFFPVWSPNDYLSLVEAIVCFQVSPLQAAAEYGVKADTEALYQEHWTRQQYAITVNGQVARWGNVRLEGRTPLGIVPYTYIPHIRIGDFYGISLLEGKLDLAREVNARFADVGDVVGQSARALPAIGNVQKLDIRRLSSGIALLDLGRGTPGMGDPWIQYPRPVQSNEATVRWASDLLTMARIEAFTPPVCYGLDEGSQRSALTLAFRMLPLLSHIRQERTLMTDGLNRVARQIAMLGVHYGILEGVRLEDLAEMRFWQEWAPILPRDRQQEVNEIILRVNNNLMSVETALARLQDIRDIQTELNLIKKWLEYQASLGAPAANSGNPFGGAGGDGELSGLDYPQEPHASLQEEE